MEKPMSNVARTKLKLDKNYTLEELTNVINQGAKFVVYQYCVSLVFAVTLRRFSPSILILPDSMEDFSKSKRRYNLISYLFGWWCMPWGPIRTIQSLRVNNRGGLDVTEDVMLNIDDESIKNKEVVLAYTNQYFIKPSKGDMVAFKKTMLRDFEMDYNIKELFVGLFINTRDNIAPFLTIGLRLSKNVEIENYIELLKKSLHKKFYKSTYFEFVDLSIDEDWGPKLRSQGELLISREGKKYEY